MSCVKHLILQQTNKEKPRHIEWRIRCFSVTATQTNHLLNDCIRTFWKRNLNQPRGTSFKNGVEGHTSFDHLIIALTSICNTELTEAILFLKEDSLWIQRQLNLNGNLAACLFSWPWESRRVHFPHLFNDPWQVFIRINKVLIHSTWHSQKLLELSLSFSNTWGLIYLLHKVHAILALNWLSHLCWWQACYSHLLGVSGFWVEDEHG